LLLKINKTDGRFRNAVRFGYATTTPLNARTLHDATAAPPIRVHPTSSAFVGVPGFVDRGRCDAAWRGHHCWQCPEIQPPKKVDEKNQDGRDRSFFRGPYRVDTRVPMRLSPDTSLTRHVAYPTRRLSVTLDPGLMERTAPIA
jgi:hypothetical protein